MLRATFFGVRGSTPCSCEGTRAFGGNTSCVLVEVAGEPPIILDLGTGARYLGLELLARQAQRSAGSGGRPMPFRGTALVTHLHWDHIQGIPFFRPLLDPAARLHLVGPAQPGSTVEAELSRFLQPPAFPVTLQQLPGQITWCDASNERIRIGSATVTAFDVPHVGPTNGYRIDAGGGSLAYLSDHQQPHDGSHEVPDHIVAACADVDVLIHDAQYDAAEFEQRRDWGHCTADYALELARRCRARRLVLYHHDPTHDDDWICATVSRVQRQAGPTIEVIGAHERLQLTSPGRRLCS